MARHAVSSPRGGVRVSWLLPVRDGRRWLADAVESVLGELDVHDEIVVVDDGSSDAPGEVLPDHPRLRLVRQPPRGIAAALEQGRRHARGRWLARIDADDRVLPGRIAAQLAILESDPGCAVGGRARVIADGGAVPEGMRRYVDWVNGLDDLAAALFVESPLFHPATTLRARAVAEVGGWRDGDLPEDYDLWLRLHAAGWGLRAVPEEVVLIRDRPARLTRTDPRYRRAAFRALKMDHLAAHVLPSGCRLVIWGAGREGRPWLRWALARGFEVPLVVDLREGVRQGRPVRRDEALRTVAFDHLLVAVGARGARALIRSRIAELRPELVEGRDWWAVA